MAEVTLQEAFELALQHHRAGRFVDAQSIYQQILVAEPDNANAVHLLGLVALQTGRLETAVAHIRQAIALSPESADAQNSLGNALHRQGQYDQAIDAYQKAIALNPEFLEAINNLGISLNEMGRLDQAIAASKLALEKNPNYAQAWTALGSALRRSGRFDESVSACLRATELQAGIGDAWSSLGSAYHRAGQNEQAITALKQAVANDPNAAEAHSNLVLAMHYHPAMGARAIADELSRWNKLHAEPLRPFIQTCSNDRNPDRRLRIGYVSPDFRSHVVARNLLPLFQQHDKKKFHVTCYAQVSRPDSMTGQIQQHVDGWRSTVGLSDEQAASQIRGDRIDILIDLALHSAGNRLLVLARKPAPVQVTFGGYPGSTGMEAIDYRLSDPYLDPTESAQQLYSELTVRLPNSFWCYDPLNNGDLPVGPLPADSNGFVTFGCLNFPGKINPDVISHWAAILHKTINSRLILLAPSSMQQQSILAIFKANGIDPDRIEFAPTQPLRQYLQVYNQVDLMLDTFPYNGHTTTLDALWMGVPVVTVIGQSPVARAGWCQLSNLSLTPLAGNSPQEFVRIAVDLAADVPRLRNLRSTLRSRMQASPLMDTESFARGIESAYLQMWREYCESGA